MSYRAFDHKWFSKHQRTILSALNSPVIGRVLRRSFGIDSSETINRITPNSYSFGARKLGDRIEVTTDFRTHDKFAKRMYHLFAPIWWSMHFLDWIFLDRFTKYSFGFSTLTAFPDAASGGTTCDGIVRRTGVNETWSTIIAGAGTSSSAFISDTSDDCSYVETTATTNQFNFLIRSIFTFDTSSITSAATISSAVFSIRGIAKYNTLGSDNLHVCGATPASNNNLVNGDFSQTGSTSFGNVAYASFSTAGYNDITLNASGISNISKTGISGFATRLGWDITATFGGSWASGTSSGFNINFADNTGTSADPKLVVTYSIGSHQPDFFLFF